MKKMNHAEMHNCIIETIANSMATVRGAYKDFGKLKFNSKKKDIDGEVCWSITDGGDFEYNSYDKGMKWQFWNGQNKTYDIFYKNLNGILTSKGDINKFVEVYNRAIEK